jgi:hypothetical protein
MNVVIIFVFYLEKDILLALSEVKFYVFCSYRL